jgi:hypothetical protein
VTDQLFSIEMFPAQQGDALWIEYGSRASPHRLLIDGGTPPTVDPLRERILGLAPGDRHFDLIAVTHVDTDHIGGMLRLLADRSLGITTDDFWFNAWPQLPGTRHDDRLGPLDGEILMRLIEAAGVPWNDAFGGAAVMVPTDPAAALPSPTLAGGMTLTVVSPSVVELAALRKTWRKVLHEAGLDGDDLEAGLLRVMRRKGVPRPDLLGDETPDPEADARSPFTPDRAVANSTSIALLAEFDGRACLLTGDAWAPVLETGIRRLLAERHLPVLRLDAFKVAHHGSKNNTSDSLLETVRCSTYLISTSGAIFHHPDHEAVSRLIVRGGSMAEPVRLLFNYLSDDDRVWRDSRLRRRFGYEPVFPAPDQDGHLRLEI